MSWTEGSGKPFVEVIESRALDQFERGDAFASATVAVRQLLTHATHALAGGTEIIGSRRGGRRIDSKALHVDTVPAPLEGKWPRNAISRVSRAANKPHTRPVNLTLRRRAQVNASG